MGSYTELSVEWQGISLRVQSAAKNDQLYVLITLVRHSTGDELFVEPEMLWNRKGEISINDNKIRVITPTRELMIRPVKGRFTSSGGKIRSSLNNEIIALTSDASISVSGLKKMINDSKISFTSVKARYKEDSELDNAMQTVLAWNANYEPTHNRVITPVSRTWNVGWEGWVLFEWDTYFAAYMLSMDNKDLAYANAIAMTNEITGRGLVPNYASSRGTSEDRSEPPVGAFIVKEIYKKYREKWFLQEEFGKLLTWNRWWAANRDEEGYLCWGSDPYKYGHIPEFLIRGIGTKKGAKWESGLDNSPMWDSAVFDSTKHLLMQADVGLMSLYIFDCRSLADIAKVLGKTAIEKELNIRAEKYSEKLETLWNDDFGLYLNKDLISGQFSYRLSPTLFYPLLTKVPGQEKAERMINAHFYNPEEFWGDFVMPSIARNDPAFKDNTYWRGRIWAPMDFLVYLGIRNYDLHGAQKDLVEKSKNLLLKSWIGERHIYENYNAETGQGDDSGMSDKFYHWGALLGFTALIDDGFVPRPESGL